MPAAHRNQLVPIALVVLAVVLGVALGSMTQDSLVSPAVVAKIQGHGLASSGLECAYMLGRRWSSESISPSGPVGAASYDPSDGPGEVAHPPAGAGPMLMGHGPDRTAVPRISRPSGRLDAVTCPSVPPPFWPTTTSHGRPGSEPPGASVAS